MPSLLILTPLAALICYFVAGFVGWDSGTDFSAPPGIVAPESPAQVKSNRPPFKYGEFQLIPAAEFSLTARLILSERYWTDGGSSLSPIDLLVGWQELSDTAVLRKVSWGHSGRHFSYSPLEDLSMSWGEIGTRVSNIHAIPGSDDIRRILLDFNPGDIIELKGLLVQARSANWAWGSSTSRVDSGSGACELMFVEEAALSRKPR